MSAVSSPLRSLFWSGLDTVGTLLVGIVSVLGIARLIGDEAFGLGVIALGLVLVAVVAVSSMVHDALVRSPDLQPEDVDTAVTASLIAGGIASCIAAALALPFAWLLDEQRLAPVLWAFVPLILLSALSAPLIAERRHALDFPLVGRHQLISRFLGLAAGLAAALAGAGVWSLVAQQLTAAGYVAFSMLALAPRRPRLRLSWRRLRPMLAFCQYIVGTQVLIQAAERMFLLAMGYWHGLSGAGHWGVATRLSESLTGSAMQAIYHVALAYLARLQQTRDRLAAVFGEAQTLLMMLAVPGLAALAAAADPLIRLVLGQDWAPTATLLLGCLLGAYFLLRRLMPLVALNAIARPDVPMKAMLGESAVGGVALLVLGALSPWAIAAIRGLTPILGSLLVARTVKTELGRPVRRELWGILRDLFCGLTAWTLAKLLAASIGTLGIELVLAAGTAFLVAFLLEAALQPKTSRDLLAQAQALLRERFQHPSREAEATRPTL